MGAATLSATFEEACGRHASITALVTPVESITYGDLLARSRRFAGALVAAGVERGDRVAVWLPNGVDWLVAHWGTALAGGVVVPIGTRNRGPEVHHVLAQSGASALVMVDRFLKSNYLAMLDAARSGVGLLRKSSSGGPPERRFRWG